MIFNNFVEKCLKNIGKNMGKNNYVIITAGGSGVRMGGDKAKQFLDIDGEPILVRTMKSFWNFDKNFQFLLVMNNSYREYWKRYCLENNFLIKHILVSGGITRFHSVKNAMDYLPDGVKVFVHDAVRPFISNDFLERISENDFLERGYDGLVPVLAPVESMREKILDGDGQITATNSVDRNRFLFVQTPQIFDSTKLKLSYRQAFSQEFTDDASVMEHAGYKITICEGSRYNIKITTKEDLRLGEIYLSLF